MGECCLTNFILLLQSDLWRFCFEWSWACFDGILHPKLCAFYLDFLILLHGSWRLVLVAPLPGLSFILSVFFLLISLANNHLIKSLHLVSATPTPPGSIEEGSSFPTRGSKHSTTEMQFYDLSPLIFSLILILPQFCLHWAFIIIIIIISPVIYLFKVDTKVFDSLL